MMAILLLSFLIFMVHPIEANPEQSFQDGKRYAEEAQKDIQNLAKKPEEDTIPAYGEPAPSISDENHLAFETAQAVQENEGADFVQKTYRKRPQIKINERTDPLVRSADRIVKNPIRSLTGTASLRNGYAVRERHQRRTCTEDHSVTFRTCTQTLSVTVDRIRQKQRYRWDCGGHLKKKKRGFIGQAFKGSRREEFHHGSSDERCDHRVNQRWVTIRNRRFPEHDSWRGCESLERQADLEKCTYHERRCLQPNESRVFTTRIRDGDRTGPEISEYVRVDDGFQDTDRSVHRPCWQYETTYACGVKRDSGCNALRRKGCVQIDSECIREENNFCTKWRHTFDCLQKGDRKSEARAGSGAPYCLDGRCVGRDYKDNDEFGEAISKLSILDSIQRDMRSGLKNLFQGVRSECSKDITNCRDCCFTLSGWGISLHLMACSSAEKMLAEKRSKGLCHFVGTYCSQKVLGLCLRKKSSFCCFKSKLGRILNEQGRKQIGKGWGSPRSPDCSGLTVEEIMRLDFSQLDLSELYEDWMRQYAETAPDADSVTDRVKGTLESVSDSMSHRQETYDQLKR